MQEVIDELLKAEAEGQKLVTAAREEAQQIKAQVEADSSGKLAAAREEARRIILAGVEKTRAAMKTTGAAAVARAEAESDALWRDQQAVIEELIEAVASLVVTPEFEGEQP